MVSEALKAQIVWVQSATSVMREGVRRLVRLAVLAVRFHGRFVTFAKTKPTQTKPNGVV